MASRADKQARADKRASVTKGTDRAEQRRAAAAARRLEAKHGLKRRKK